MLPAHTWSQMNLHQRVAACNADISEHPQFGRLTGVVFMGDVIIDDTPTAATNGRDVMYGNAFCGKLNQKQLRYVDLHENMHKSLRHTTLYQDIVKRFPDESNRAQDYVINGLIEEIDPHFQFVERPCAVLVDPKYQGMGFIEVLRDLVKNPQSDPQPKTKPLDDHDNMEPDAQLDAEVEDALQQGRVVNDRIRGDKGGSNPLDVLVKQRDTNWREALFEFVQSVCDGDDASRICPPNKRLLPAGFLMWSHYSEAMGDLIVACDTSGSMNGVYPVMFGEIAHICQTLNPAQVRVLWWDTMVRSEQVFTPDNYADIATMMKPHGGGGTRVSCVANYIKEKQYEPIAMIYLTDGYIEDVYKTAALPSLWGVVDNPRFVPLTGKKIDICSFTI